MSACPLCGSDSPRRGTAPSGECSNLKGCNERRCARRIEASRKANPNGHQCHSTTGHASVLFCLLREGHGGLHLNGTREWGGDYEHPVAAAIRGP